MNHPVLHHPQESFFSVLSRFLLCQDRLTSQAKQQKEPTCSRRQYHYDVPYSLTLKSQGFIKKQKICKTTLTYDDQEMQKKCVKKQKKGSWSKRLHIKKQKIKRKTTV